MSYKQAIGKKFGRLKVLKLSRKEKQHPYLLCLCDCGNTKEIYLYNLTSGKTTSCGCYHREKFRNIRLIKIDRRRKFGRLKIIGEPIKKGSKTFYPCQCDCGNKSNVESYTLRHGLTKSCGCLQREAVTTHGRSQTREYKIVKAAERRAIIYSLNDHYCVEDIEQKFREQEGLCYYCDIDLRNVGFHRDHMIPLSRGGTNSRENICLTCRPCNLRKNTKTADEFLNLQS